MVCSVSPPATIFILNYALHEGTDTPEVWLSVAGPTLLSIPLAYLMSGYYQYIDEKEITRNISTFLQYLEHTFQ